MRPSCCRLWQVASFELQQHLAMLKTKRKAVEAEAAAHGKQAVEPKVAEEVQAKVAGARVSDPLHGCVNVVHIAISWASPDG